ncbi:MAG TPA: DUF6623 family protein [Ktedonobacteraceae bacterium]
MKEQQTDTDVAVPSTSFNRRKLLTYAAPLSVSAAIAPLASQHVGAASSSMSHAGIVPGPSSPTRPSSIPAPQAPGAPADVLASAMWIQGNALTVENPATTVNIVHIGWGTVVYGIPGRSSWFHIPIPSPVIINNQRPYVTKVFLMFDIGPGMGYISNVHLYDGGYNFKQFNGLYLVGDHRTYLDASNTFVLDVPRTIYLALGISFNLNFTGSSPWFTISSAGGDFHLP